MSNARVYAMAITAAEGILDYGPSRSRLMIQVMRRLAEGQPVTQAEADQIASDLGLMQVEAHQFLRPITERDTDDRIVGITGLSLNNHPHRLHVNGVSLSAWCAGDTLFLPSMLNQTAIVESYSPATKEKIQLTVSPERVETVSPSGAVVSIVVVDPNQDNMTSVEAIWFNYCHHIHFFASREEAERWATGKAHITVLTVNEGFEFARQMWSRVLPYAATVTQNQVG